MSYEESKKKFTFADITHIRLGFYRFPGRYTHLFIRIESYQNDMESTNKAKCGQFCLPGYLLYCSNLRLRCKKSSTADIKAKKVNKPG